MDKLEIENEYLTGGTPEEGAYATTYEAFELVLEKAGASLPRRDAID